MGNVDIPVLFQKSKGKVCSLSSLCLLELSLSDMLFNRLRTFSSIPTEKMFDFAKCFSACIEITICYCGVLC
jgi:hypothetical protein